VRHEAQSAAPNEAAIAYKTAPVVGIRALLSGRKDVIGMRHIAMVLAFLLSPTTSSDRARGLNERIPNS
jgi:hypothetical protein